MKAKFRFNLERTEHDIEVHEDGTVTITAESGAELTFESVKALALEFAASRNTPANILKNFTFSSANSTVKNITHVLKCLPDIYSYTALESEC